MERNAKIPTEKKNHLRFNYKNSFHKLKNTVFTLIYVLNAT